MTMEREKAIKMLQHCGTEIYCPHYIETRHCYGCNRRDALDMAIEALSTEGVRCRDCRHRVHDKERGLYYCEMYYGQGNVSDENFCQWGERREE